MFGTIQGSSNLTTLFAVEGQVTAVDLAAQVTEGFGAIFLQMNADEVVNTPVADPRVLETDPAAPGGEQSDIPASDHVDPLAGPVRQELGAQVEVSDGGASPGTGNRNLVATQLPESAKQDPVFEANRGQNVEPVKTVRNSAPASARRPEGDLQNPASAPAVAHLVTPDPFAETNAGGASKPNASAGVRPPAASQIMAAPHIPALSRELPSMSPEASSPATERANTNPEKTADGVPAWLSAGDGAAKPFSASPILNAAGQGPAGQGATVPGPVATLPQVKPSVQGAKGIGVEGLTGSHANLGPVPAPLTPDPSRPGQTGAFVVSRPEPMVTAATSGRYGTQPGSDRGLAAVLGNHGPTQNRAPSQWWPMRAVKLPSNSDGTGPTAPQPEVATGYRSTATSAKPGTLAPDVGGNGPVNAASKGSVHPTPSGAGAFPTESAIEKPAAPLPETRARVVGPDGAWHERSPVAADEAEKPRNVQSALRQPVMQSSFTMPIQGDLTTPEGRVIGMDADSLLLPLQPRGPETLNMPGPVGLQSATPAQQVDLARSVAQQIAEVAVQRHGGAVEIRLSPEELGAVRMTLSGNESQMTLSILVDRGETAELMRRHIEQLAREFREIGYSGLSFSFEQGSAGQRNAAGHAQAGTAVVEGDEMPEIAPEPQSPSAGRRVGPDGAMDLRV